MFGNTSFRQGGAHFANTSFRQGGHHFASISFRSGVPHFANNSFRQGGPHFANTSFRQVGHRAAVVMSHAGLRGTYCGIQCGGIAGLRTREAAPSTAPFHCTLYCDPTATDEADEGQRQLSDHDIAMRTYTACEMPRRTYIVCEMPRRLLPMCITPRAMVKNARLFGQTLNISYFETPK